jgi:tRNA U34 5-carboxymethylaminomethyl modifying enzyme MnmG/GidA
LRDDSAWAGRLFANGDQEHVSSKELAVEIKEDHFKFEEEHIGTFPCVTGTRVEVNSLRCMEGDPTTVEIWGPNNFLADLPKSQITGIHIKVSLPES